MMKQIVLMCALLLSTSMTWANGIMSSPVFNNEEADNPHNTGIWLVTLDRNNNEIWQELNYEDYNVYSAIVRLNCYIYGFETIMLGNNDYNYPTLDDDIPFHEYNNWEDPWSAGAFYYLKTYDARFCYVIDGVRFGPEENYVECVLGYALDNPLVEGDNYYTTMTGYTDCFGLYIDDSGNPYAYLAIGSFIGASENFPDYMNTILLGDVDGDGMISISDVTASIDLLLSGDASDNPNADVDGDGIASIADVTELIDMLLKAD
jgi:hypothetical protein